MSKIQKNIDKNYNYIVHNIVRIEAIKTPCKATKWVIRYNLNYLYKALHDLTQLTLPCFKKKA